jgi:GTP-binding protein
VGKSTLFNRLIGGRPAIVHNRPGITRDRHYESTDRWCDRELLIVDTGGLEPDPDDDLFASMRVQSLAATEEADIVLWMVDARAGLTPLDDRVAALLRSSEKPVILVVNKVDVPSVEPDALEFHALGFAEFFTISAEHARGLSDLMYRVSELLPMDIGEPEIDPQDTTGEMRIAVIGRPNIGKSTLVNLMVGEERHVVHDMPGTTMDAVDSPLEVDGQKYILVDTAGVRKKRRISDIVEGFAVSRAIRSVERCHVSLLMIDGTLGVTDQDARLAALVTSRGRALILLINKWDLVKDDPERSSRNIGDEIERRLPHAPWAPVIYISALTGKGTHRILEEVHRVYEQFDKRIPTAECNRFLEAAIEAHSPPQRHHRPVRLNYMTQIRVRPPTFMISCNTPEGVLPAYKRYLQNRLRDFYGFKGTPIRIQFNRKRRAGESKKAT